MSRNLIYFLTLLIIGSMTVGCNKKDDEDETEIISVSDAAVVVSSFKISKNTALLTGIDSVYFSIDLDNALIFNADSLPYGTAVNKLVPVIGTQGCEVAELIVSRKNLPDTTYNYLTNSTDSIDFSNGPVTLHLVALDGVTQRDYKIYVNVHRMQPDSLYWNRTARRTLPSAFQVPNQQKACADNNTFYCLTSSSSDYCLATTDDPSAEWFTSALSFPFTPQVETFNVANGTYYILDSAGTLWSSADKGATWTSSLTSVTDIYGSYNDQIICVQRSSSGYAHILYPSGTATAVPAGCPVNGITQLVTFSNDWAYAPQAFVIGGRDADGNLTGAMWGFDGECWTKISLNDTPEAENKTFFSYTTFLTDTTNLQVTALPTLFCMGGSTDDGSLVRDTYISIDMGLHWKKADDLAQLPDYIPSMTAAQALVHSTTLYAGRSASSWEEYTPKRLPSWWTITTTPPASRATTPITQWDCPYIYLFGGCNDHGALYNTLWRGVTNRLTFKPLQ